MMKITSGQKRLNNAVGNLCEAGDRLWENVSKKEGEVVKRFAIVSRDGWVTDEAPGGGVQRAAGWAQACGLAESARAGVAAEIALNLGMAGYRDDPLAKQLRTQLREVGATIDALSEIFKSVPAPFTM